MNAVLNETNDTVSTHSSFITASLCALVAGVSVATAAPPHGRFQFRNEFGAENEFVSPTYSLMRADLFKNLDFKIVTELNRVANFISTQSTAMDSQMMSDVHGSFWNLM